MYCVKVEIVIVCKKKIKTSIAQIKKEIKAIAELNCLLGGVPIISKAENVSVTKFVLLKI